MKVVKKFCSMALVLLIGVPGGNLGKVFSMDAEKVAGCFVDREFQTKVPLSKGGKEVQADVFISAFAIVVERVNVSTPFMVGSDEKFAIFNQTIKNVSDRANAIKSVATLPYVKPCVFIHYNKLLFPMATDDIDLMKSCIQKNTGINVSDIIVEEESSH
jgi:hypothetical protein